MPYTAPELDALLQNFPTRETIPNETLPRYFLIDQLTIITEVIKKQKKIKQDKDQEFLGFLVGANVYCLDIIAQEYYLHSPELKIGYIYTSGSPLYSFIANRLNISETNPLSARDKLIYLNLFYQFITHHEVDLQAAASFTLPLKELQNKLKKMLENLLSTLTTDIANVVNAIPTEKSITGHMGKLPSNYKLKKERAKTKNWCIFFNTENKSRVLLTQLMHLISTIKCEDESNLPSDVMTRSQRIKLGMLIFTTKSISKEYRFLSPTRSDLYKESKEILNSQMIENLNSEQTLACLSALRSLLSCHKERARLEQAAQDYFNKENLLKNIDTILNPICAELHRMEEELTVTSSNWPATKAFSNAGMVLGAIQGYGFGTVVGLGASQTQSTQFAKSTVGAGVSNFGKAFFQLNSLGYFSFVMGDFLIKSTLTRAFAKLFEIAGMAMVGGAGVLIGITIDLSYLGLRAACKHFLKYCDENPGQICNADCQLVQCLLDLPSDLFPEEMHNQILYAQGADIESKLESAEKLTGTQILSLSGT